MKNGTKRLALHLLQGTLLLFAYLVAGAFLPFSRYKKVTKETKRSFRPEDYKGKEPCVDRALLLESGRSAWEFRMRLLNQAKSRIILSTFDMRDGECARDVLAVILRKAKEGVKAQILVDGFSGLIRLEPNPLFYAVSCHPNVEIKIYNPINLLKPWKSQGRMHDKYVIVDDYAYILGGRNTFDYFIGEKEGKRIGLDREVLIYNTAHDGSHSRESSLFQVEAYFQKVWSLDVCRTFHKNAELADRQKIRRQIRLLEERYENLQKRHPELMDTPFDYASNTRPVNRVTLVSGSIGIYGKEPRIFYTLTSLMRCAKKRVIIHTPYVVTNDYMNATFRKLVREVPDVKMVINSVENGDNFVASSDYLHHKKDVVRTGLRLYEYDGGHSTHGKSFVIDENLCGIGSYNFDLRSTYMDTELMLVLHSEPFTADLLEAMEAIEKDCRRVLDEKRYEVPDHVTVASVPRWKRIAWRVVHVLLRPFRCVA